MDEKGKMSEADLRKVKLFLAANLTSPCWNCGKAEWSIFPIVIGEEFYDGEGRFMSSAYLAPKIRMTCANCGCIAYFSAEMLDLKVDQDGK